MKCVIANDGENVKLTRKGFVEICILRRTRAMVGWTPGKIGQSPPEYQIDVCQSCKIGEDVENGKTFDFPDYIEEIHIKDFKRKESVNMTAETEHSKEKPKNIESILNEYLPNHLNIAAENKLKPKKKPSEKLEDLQLAFGKVIFSQTKYQNLSGWAKAINKLSHQATLLAVEMDVAGRN